MSEHVAEIRWTRGGHEFGYETYSRDHSWRFDNGVVLAASANPIYLGSSSAVDPEEAFVAAISSCHMLTFLAIAARKRLVVDAYSDRAVGRLEKNAAGRLAITQVTLDPQIEWGADMPALATLAQLHHLAHQECFIANSVTADIVVAGF